MAAVQNTTHYPTKTPARPAEPVLASALIDTRSLDSIFENLDLSHGTASHLRVLHTSVSSLDGALGSTLQSGRVVALSGENSSQRDDMAKLLLVDCLVRYTESVVAVIDTTGNFDVVGLYKLILERLEKEPGKVVQMDGESGESQRQTAEGAAARVLDRVKMMRVFDFVGMREAVGELRDGLEGRTAKSEADGAHEDMQMVQGNVAAEAVTDKVPSPPPRKAEIADSEDEDDGLEASDDEMLFDNTAPPPDPGPASDPGPTSSPTQPEQPDASRPNSNLGLKLILIDNLSHVLTPLLKRDAISANTLAPTFLTTLLHLTHTHALHTILLNPCTAPRAASPAPRPASTTSAPQQPNLNPTYTPQPPPAPSIFSSNATVPGLLGLMSRYADAHVLVSVLPRGKMDARVYYGDTGGRERGKRRGVEMVGVLEVVADRWGGRVGAWGVFKEGREGTGVEGVRWHSIHGSV